MIDLLVARFLLQIHEFMTGRIKLLKNSKVLRNENKPEISYSYDILSEFDTRCGTFKLDEFQLPNDVCPSRFVCPNADSSDVLKTFTACIDAMNCAMFAGMTTNVAAGSNIALFIHQMIPHHLNAVNMAKALHKTNSLECDDLTSDSEDCRLAELIYSMISSQNYQVQVMNRILEVNKNYPLTDDCDISLKKYQEIAVSENATILQLNEGVGAPTGPDARNLQGEICTSENNVFTVVVDLFAGELGLYQFRECGNQTNPTIGIEIGETYTFIQQHVSNYFHPMGFAYYADGTRKSADLLDPGYSPTAGNVCPHFGNCSAPIYLQERKNLGRYNNIPELGPLTSDEDDTGLDTYEQKFFHPITEWVGYGEFSVKLRFTDEDFRNDIFYFCHVSRT
jgi:hypothetical protein